MGESLAVISMAPIERCGTFEENIVGVLVARAGGFRSLLRWRSPATAAVEAAEVVVWSRDGIMATCVHLLVTR